MLADGAERLRVRLARGPVVWGRLPTHCFAIVAIVCGLADLLAADR